MGLSFRNIKELTGIDGGQASKICSGKFATLNPSVLKICKELGVDPTSMEENQNGQSEEGSIRRRLEAEVLAIWDNTQEGGEQLVLLLRQLKAFRRGDRTDDTSQ